MQYQFLVGERFKIINQLYRVHAITTQDEVAVVRASCVSGATDRVRTFSLEKVLQHLLVDEEITVQDTLFWEGSSAH